MGGGNDNQYGEEDDYYGEQEEYKGREAENAYDFMWGRDFFLSLGLL